MNNKITKLIPLGLAILPLAAAAATDANSIITTLQGIVSLLLPLFMAIAVVVFIWGVIRYITAAGDEEKVKEAKSFIMYGLIGLFVIVAMWGLVKVIADTFGIAAGGTSGVSAPNVP